MKSKWVSPVALASSSLLVVDQLRLHRGELEHRFGVERLRLFGSHARRCATAESDVDLLVSFKESATARRFYGLQLFLEDLLQRPVDLVTEKALRLELRQTVEHDAITI